MKEKEITYISLFSGAGVGCYGFKEAGFSCVATAEIIGRRLNVQRYNRKCVYDSGYICGDLTLRAVKDRIFSEIDRWKKERGLSHIDVVIATPPCQGMSVANHKKKDELGRNSLVVESLKLISEISPNFFVLENVRAFLKSICTDIDGKDKTIIEAIRHSLAGKYHIEGRILNFKEYGCPSSRTRTLVIGTRKDIPEITPPDLFPDRKPETTLREVIGHLPSLKIMGEICENDIYHAFKRYPPHMEEWVAHIKEGQSAFDNSDPSLIPWSLKNGERIRNVNKNGDKYTRQAWDATPPCVHTRNDIMASQNTVHPSDNRVFSIREIMLMMSVPETFRWSDIPESVLNGMTLPEKESYLKKEEMNIRQTLGESVPTAIFRQIADKIKRNADIRSDKEILPRNGGIGPYIKGGEWLALPNLFRTIEFSNENKEASAAFYTRQDICFSIISKLPSFYGRKGIRIIEPAAGAGNFLPLLARRYSGIEDVRIDLVDSDPKALATLKKISEEIDLPGNVSLNFINADFLTYDFDVAYDLAVGNPPFGKVKDKTLLAEYRKDAANTKTSNLFSFFLEKAMRIARYVALITPKSLISAPEFDETRKSLAARSVERIIDYGEKAFKGVKIETICLMIDTVKSPGLTDIESYITWGETSHPQAYVMDPAYPNWLLYRNRGFDDVASRMRFDIFSSWRDRVITKSLTKASGSTRVLKSRNIGDNRIVNIPGYDCWLDSVAGLDVARFLDNTKCVLVPNLTYSPRACFMPKGCVADGSVAILTSKIRDRITKKDLAYYATDEFAGFYSIARNLGSRSLNIDRNSVFYFGKSITNP